MERRRKRYSDSEREQRITKRKTTRNNTCILNSVKNLLPYILIFLGVAVIVPLYCYLYSYDRCHGAVIFTVIQNPLERAGIVESCNCGYSTVASLNEDHLYGLIKDLVTTRYFSRIKVKLEACRVQPGYCLAYQQPNHTDLTPWILAENPWTTEVYETDNGEMATDLDLLEAREIYTESSAKLAQGTWDSIYSENCPEESTGEDFEESDVVRKLICGLHTSMTVHITVERILNEAPDLYDQKVKKMLGPFRQKPIRMKNLFFTYLMVLRAVTKVAKNLKAIDCDTGSAILDAYTLSVMRNLLNNPMLRLTCHFPCNETILCALENRLELIEKMQNKFRNISTLIDELDSESSRLWGGLQMVGLETATKILFPLDRRSNPSLERNEVIALMNLFKKLSDSILYLVAA